MTETQLEPSPAAFCDVHWQEAGLEAEADLDPRIVTGMQAPKPDSWRTTLPPIPGNPVLINFTSKIGGLRDAENGSLLIGRI